MQNKTFLRHYSELLSLDLGSEKSILFADSGGTKTDWCLICGDHFYFFSTESYHPYSLSSPTKLDLLLFWKDLTKKLGISCHFYGAGCSSEENQTKIREHFTTETHFIVFEVASDLVAAGISLLGNQEGYVGILGTGSVLTYYKNKQITEIIGGFGYLLGDEGSGYYFGKLVLQKFLSNTLSDDLQALIVTSYGARKHILSKSYQSDGKSFISGIQLHSENPIIQEEIDRIHSENIELFLTTYLPKETKQKEISFVGSYAFYQQNLLKEALEKVGWKLVKVIQKPIDALAERETDLRGPQEPMSDGASRTSGTDE
jgi:hypothetical protein